MIRVAIAETDVLGAKGYRARCLECGWESKCMDREPQAVALAKKHTDCPKAKTLVIQAARSRFDRADGTSGNGSICDNCGQMWVDHIAPNSLCPKPNSTSK